LHLVIDLKGSGSVPINFNDLSLEKKIDVIKGSKDHRTVVCGLNLFGICKNN
jgi:hypothetical protein